MAFKRLVRFANGDARCYGDLIEAAEKGYRVRKLNGSVKEGFKNASDEVFEVRSVCRHSKRVASITDKPVFKLLCPLEETPIVQCIGLNYKQHAKEASVRLQACPNFLW
jgi:2-keto-4-pentenoate hydratase/2-oxohepta-3-ene-1,7-dioic acid hydratase in catechol pathway